MKNLRLVGILGTLWFFFALMMIFIATVLSPMGLRILLPDRQPATWALLGLLFGTPLLLAGLHFAPPKVSAVLIWVICGFLALLTAALFLFLTALFVGR